MTVATSPNNQLAGQLIFDIIKMPPSIGDIEQAKELALSDVRKCKSFLKGLVIFSVVTLLMFTLLAYAIGIGLSVTTSIIILMSFSACSAANGVYSSAIFFNFFATSIAILALSNQPQSVILISCTGLICITIPYFRLANLEMKRSLSELKLSQLKPLNQEQEKTFNSWSEFYPAVSHYLVQAQRMPRPLVVAEYEAAIDFVIQFNNQHTRSHFKTMNFVPFFFG